MPRVDEWTPEQLLSSLHTQLRDVQAQATRHERASDLKRYLKTDLELIAKQVESALTRVERLQSFLAPSPSQENR